MHQRRGRYENTVLTRNKSLLLGGDKGGSRANDGSKRKRQGDLHGAVRVVFKVTVYF